MLRKYAVVPVRKALITETRIPSALLFCANEYTIPAAKTHNEAETETKREEFHSRKNIRTQAASISEIRRGIRDKNDPEIKPVTIAPKRTDTEPRQPVHTAAATGIGEAILPSCAQEKIRPHKKDNAVSRNNEKDDFFLKNSFDI